MREGGDFFDTFGGFSLKNLKKNVQGRSARPPKMFWNPQNMSEVRRTSSLDIFTRLVTIVISDDIIPMLAAVCENKFTYLIHVSKCISGKSCRKVPFYFQKEGQTCVFFKFSFKVNKKLVGKFNSSVVHYTF